MRPTCASIAATLILAACTLPMQQDPAGPAASLRVRNAGEGFTQAMTFGDAQTCADAHVLGYAMRSGVEATFKVPANQVITLSMGAFGLTPSQSNQIAWCKPAFLSARLKAGVSYQLSYKADAATQTCGPRLVETATGAAVPVVIRDGRGGQFSGTTSEPSCKPDPSIDRL